MLEAVLKKDAGSIPARQLMLRCCDAVDDVAGVVAQFKMLLKRKESRLDILTQLSNYCLHKGCLDKAFFEYKKLLKDKNVSSAVVFNYAYYLSKGGLYDESIRYYKRCLAMSASGPEEIHLNIANIYMDHLRDDVAASKHLHQAIVLRPNYASAYFNLGNLAEHSGDRAMAQAHFKHCLELDPKNESALARLADAHHFADNADPLFQQLVMTAKKTENADVHFALGHAAEQCGLNDLAWDHYSKANALDQHDLPAYTSQETEHYFDQIIKNTNAEWLASVAGASDHAPVFICGMFRSGSTLLEQILAAHPSFTPAGERDFLWRTVFSHFPAYPKELATLERQDVAQWAKGYENESLEVFGAGPLLTDKRPDNFLYIGLIKAMFPKAKIILTQRDWRDVACSLYSQRLGRGQSYAVNIKAIKHYIEAYNRLVVHYMTLFPDDITKVSYENVVRDPQKEASKVLTFLKQPWHDDCLRFNELNNSVRTASVWQVRNPLYSSSVGRWKKFEKQFESALNEA